MSSLQPCFPSLDSSDDSMEDLDYFIKVHENHKTRKPLQFEDILNFLYDKPRSEVEVITIDDDECPNNNSIIPKQITSSLLIKRDDMVFNFKKYDFSIPDWKPLMSLEFPFDVLRVTGEDMLKHYLTFIKTFDGFKSLPEDDRVALIQGSSTEFVLWKMFQQFDEKSSSWAIPDRKAFKRYFDVNFCFKFWGFDKVAHYFEIVKKFKPKWRHDVGLMVVILAILLHNPQRQKLKDTAFVRDYQERLYYPLLQQHLLEKYNDIEEAEWAFNEIILLIQQVRNLGADLKSTLLTNRELQETFFRLLPPLILEFHGLLPA